MSLRTLSLALVASASLLASACGAPPPPPETPEAVPCPRGESHGYSGHDGGAEPVPSGTPGSAGTPAKTGSTEVVAAAGGAKPGAKPPPTKHTRTPYKPGARPAPPVNGKCGGKDNPCPLQKWMRANIAPALAGKNANALAVALEKSAAFSPDPSWTWAAIANKAAAAARNGDIAAARTSCTGCHAAYKQPYKDKFRTRPVK
ncbi:MAG: hypothetical protein U0169_12365 [Polyangiaceae bacterium]